MALHNCLSLVALNSFSAFAQSPALLFAIYSHTIIKYFAHCLPVSLLPSICPVRFKLSKPFPSLWALFFQPPFPDSGQTYSFWCHWHLRSLIALSRVFSICHCRSICLWPLISFILVGGFCSIHGNTGGRISHSNSTIFTDSKFCWISTRLAFHLSSICKFKRDADLSEEDIVSLWLPKSPKLFSVLTGFSNNMTIFF